MTQHDVYTPELRIQLCADQSVVKTNETIAKVRQEGLNVYYASHLYSKEYGLTYLPDCMTVISPVDGRPKFSTGYAQCIGIVAVGQSRDLDRVLSFLLHGNPDYFFDSSNNRRLVFREQLQTVLVELMLRSKQASVRTFIFAGETQFTKGTSL